MRRAVSLLVRGAVALALAAPSFGQPFRIGGRLDVPQELDPKDIRVSLVQRVDLWQTGTTWLAGSAPEPVATAALDERGLFRLAAPGPGAWQVRVVAPGIQDLIFEVGPLVRDVDLPRRPLVAALERTLTIGDSSGHPVPGARAIVRSGPRHRGYRLSPPPAFPADDDGLLRLRVPNDGEVEIGASGFDSVVVAASETRIRLRPSRDASLVRLALAGADGLPAAQALVVDRELGPVAWATPEGHAHLLLAPQQQLVFVTADGSVGALDVSAPVPAEIAIELASPPMLQGSVTSLDAGPLDDAWVRAPGLSTVVATDQRGTFVAAILGELDATMTAYAPWHLEARTAIRRGATNDGLELVLRPAAGLAGSVSDATGRPIVAAEITASPVHYRNGARARRARTYGDGLFGVSGLLPETPYEVRVEADGFAPFVDTIDAPRARDTLELSIHLGSGSSLGGRVVGEGGAPIAGAEVWLLPTADSSYEEFRKRSRSIDVFSATTGGDGFFLVDGVRQGTYDVKAQARGYALAWRPGVRLHGRTLGDDLVLPLGAAVQGRVVDASSRPLQAVEVWLKTSNALMRETRDRQHHSSRGSFQPTGVLTASDGTFHVRDRLPGETFDLRFSLQGFSELTLPGVSAPSAEELEVTMTRASSVRGVVVDTRGDPVGYAHAHLQTPDAFGETTSAGHASMYHAAVDRDGAFHFQGVAAAEYELRVDDKNNSAESRQTIRVEKGRSIEDLRVVLEIPATATLRGSVRTARGDPIDAMITVERADGGARGEETDFGGRFELELPLGPITLVAHRPNGGILSEEVEVRDGENQVSLVFDGFTVSGFVVDRGGERQRHARVLLEQTVIQPNGHGRTRQSEGQTDSRGRFTFEDVEAGDYRIGAQRSRFRHPGAGQEITVTGDLTGLTLELDDRVTLTGRIRGLAPSRIASLRLAARGPGHGIGKVDAAGRYEIRGLSPGEWTIALEGVGVSVPPKPVSIPEGVDSHRFDIDLDGAGLTVSGRVLLDGEPQQGVMVVLPALEDSGAGPQTSTDHRGRFLFRGVPSGRMVIYAITGSATARADLTLGQDLEITLDLLPR